MSEGMSAEPQATEAPVVSGAPSEEATASPEKKTRARRTRSATPKAEGAAEVEEKKPTRRRRRATSASDESQAQGSSEKTAAKPDSAADPASISPSKGTEGDSASSEGKATRLRRSSSAKEASDDQGAKAPKADDASKQGDSTDRKDGKPQDDAPRERAPRSKRSQRNRSGKAQGGQKFQKDSHHRNRRQQHRNEPMVPQTSREELAKLKVAELREKAAQLELEVKGLKKAELVEAVFAASVKAEGFVEIEGILDVLPEGYGFLRTGGYLPGENDVYVGLSAIRKNGLRKGDYLTGQTRPARPNEKYAALQRIDTVNGTPLDQLGKRVRFADLTPVFPDERLVLEHGRSSITARVIDLCSPIGKGQRGLIVSPPKAGKTTILKDIAASITANNPEVHLMCLLVDERPEEVTDMERSIRGEVISSTFDMPCENHIAVSEMVIERAKRLVENGEDVVILLDSLTRLARAYNLAQPASGRILSGGVDSTALYPPKKFLGAARNIEGGGSLTILASALIETGSKMDEVIFEEFKGTGNMEVKLDRSLADRRIFPAIDPIASGTRREDLLLDPQEAPLIWAVRRVLSNRNNIERAMDTLIKSLQQTRNNEEFLLRAAKKAQGRHFEEGSTIEF